MMPLSPGQILNNRYRVVKLLASGGYGTVYRAWDLSLNGPCALKVIPTQALAAQHQIAREANLLAQLSHTNLPQVRDYFVIPGQSHYIVMEFVDGDDLETLRMKNNGAFSEAEVLPWFRQVCGALTYLHNQSPPVIHRDIKPANIRITPQGKAVLVDFGIAKQQLAGQVTSTGAKAVTAGYSPPEQYLGRGTDQRSDVYALGATLYTLLTGVVLPESIQRMMTQGGKAPVDVYPPDRIRPGISNTVSAAVMRAIRLDASQRFASIDEFNDALFHPQRQNAAWPVNAPSAVSTVGRRPRKPTTVANPVGKPQRNWKVWLGVVLALAVIAGFIGTGVMLANQFNGTPARVAGVATSTQPAPANAQPATAAITETTAPPVIPSDIPAAPTVEASPTSVQPVPAPGVTEQPLEIDPASFNAVSVLNEPSSVSGIRLELLNSDGSPRKGAWVSINKQIVDVSNNPLAGDRLESGYTNEGGQVSFELPPGTYAVNINDLSGYPWGSPFNYVVQGGTTTVVRVALGSMVIGLRNAAGLPLRGHGVNVYRQDQDLLGNPVRGDRVASGYTNDAGIIGFELTPGLYAITINNLLGDAWGSELNYAVLPGQKNQLLVTTGKLVVGVVDANGSPVKGIWVGTFQQRLDVTGSPTLSDRITGDYTDNTGSVQWDMTAGTYGIQIKNLTGYQWGSELNHGVVSGNQTTVLVELGRLVVGVKDGAGNPIGNRRVGVYLQRKDVNGNVTQGDGVNTRYTDASGLVSFELTQGNYAVEIDKVNTLMDVVVAPRKITFTDGYNQEFR